MKMGNKKKLKIFTGVILGVMIGALTLLAKVVITKETGSFSIGTAINLIGTMLLGISFSYLISTRKKGRNRDIAEVDERTILILKNYFMWAFYLVMIGSGLFLIILYFMDIATIELGMLFVYQMFLFIIVAIGAFIVKKIG